MSIENPKYNDPIPLCEKARKLALWRILVLFLLMTASLFWNGEAFLESLEEFARPPFLIFVVAFVLTLAFWFALNIKKLPIKLNKNLPDKYLSDKSLLILAGLQFLADVFLITWLVWTTGDVRSPYATLYTVLICLVSIFFGARGTLFTAVGCTIVFTSLALLVTYGYLPHLVEPGGGAISTKRALQIIGFHDVAFLVVGLLAAQLASRHSYSSVRLQKTEQNLADLQRLHERIVQSIRSGLVTTDLEGKIYLFNAAAEEITGYRTENVRGMKIFDFLGNIEQPIAVSLEAAQNNNPPPRFETDFSTPDGFAIRLGYGISPLFAENGEMTGLILTFQDLTEMRTMEESVRRKERLAAVGRVAAGLAHEIRNPLGAMRGAIQVLQIGMKKNSSQAQLMDIVLRESDRLNTIITNFLTYARPQQGEVIETDICQIIRDSVTLLRHSPDVRACHAVIEDLPQTPVTALADSAGLKQVFWNLARNAVQSMPNGGCLTIKLSCLLNNRLQITFLDTGCGMPANQVERLFEPFSTSTTGGNGLGLSIVYQIIRDHNGTINVRSQENKGTTITIELPSEARLKDVSKSEGKPEFALPPVPLDGVKIFDDSKLLNRF
ncbi:MAG TPA: ATP-binding protein [Pyrinomonadaceae bacterium]|nr:ATP-binding protein [Pyrinomonadaceae bacterium]